MFSWLKKVGAIPADVTVTPAICHLFLYTDAPVLLSSMVGMNPLSGPRPRFQAQMEPLRARPRMSSPLG